MLAINSNVIKKNYTDYQSQVNIQSKMTNTTSQARCRPQPETTDFCLPIYKVYKAQDKTCLGCSVPSRS